MRILQVYRDYFTDLPGGIERHVHDLAHGLQHLGSVEVVVSSRLAAPRTTQDGDVTVHRARELGRIQGLPITPGFVGAMRKEFDIVHLHSPNPTAELAFKFAPRRTAGILTYHADLDRGAGAALVHHRVVSTAMHSCRWVLASSERLVNLSPVLSRFRDEQPSKLAIVPFGVDTDRFSPTLTERAKELRQEWGPRPAVLFVGRLRPYKGLSHLIQAMRAVDATLVIVGDGAERERITQLGKELLGARFVLVSATRDDDLPDYYRAADIFCLPSTSSAETFGISVLEALASGLPAVTTEIGTATSVVNSDGETGFVVPPADPGALTDAVGVLLTDESLRSRAAEAGRQRVLRNYGRKQMLERVTELYQEAVQAKS
jgi:glycosyltransferase involved in cell wall biosynthesis